MAAVGKTALQMFVHVASQASRQCVIRLMTSRGRQIPPFGKLRLQTRLLSTIFPTSPLKKSLPRLPLSFHISLAFHSVSSLTSSIEFRTKIK